MTAWDGERIIAALSTHNITADCIDWVVCTHGHSDHIGNNALFLNATHAVGYSISKREDYILHDFETEPEFIIDDEVKIRATPGHTMTDVSVIVNTADKGIVAVVGDLFEREQDIEDEQLWLEKDLVLLGYVGKKISEQFCELLIKNCLADTVPSTPNGLDKYNNEVVVAIESLQNFLLECAFLTEENQSILEYANNVDVLFANKTCQVYLEKATIILKKDLHDMLEVGSDTCNDAVQKSLNIFPKCCISRSTCEYLDLLRRILDQASTSSDMCASRLVYTVAQIIGLYGSTVPEYHKKLLETIPQQVALFHNNCMYLANELLTLNKYYRDETSNRAVSDESFTSQVQLLRTTGANYFLKFMRSQIKQIEDILKESTLSKLGQSDDLDSDCEKYIRQCLRQLELLKTVWQKVLSYEMYNKAIGELLNSFVDNLITLVIAVEDISADNCAMLVSVYGVVKTRAPKLFTEPNEINLYTKHWYKFNELILILNSSLADINDRWADGKGPLAVEFKPEEVKGLIRALFQNTDRRAAVLARII
ncbi:Zeste-white 10 [Carabus blaptoides fortunei]